MEQPKYLTIFYQYLNQFRVDKGSKEFTHNSMGKPACCYKIPDEELEQFYHYYTKSIKDGEFPHLIEKHRELSPILIDIDLRFPNESGYLTQKNYNIELIREICNIYGKQIKHFLKIDEVKFHIFEKDMLPKLDKNYIKEGIHIMCFDVVTQPDFQYVLRQKVLDEIELLKATSFTIKNVISDLPVVNDWKDIIDESIIERNGWMMYGSCKPQANPDDEIPYKLSNIYEYNNQEFIDKKEIKKLNSAKNLENLIKMFSIRGYSDPTPYKNTLLEDEAREYYNNRILGITDETMNDSKPVLKSKRRRLQFTYDEIEQLVGLLSPTRAESYKDWVEVGWCLHNICSESLLDLWIKFSKQSPKFEQGSCEKYWNKMKDEGLYIGSLIMWAKKDNPDGFKKWQKNDITQLILNSLNNFTHTTIAEILFRKHGHEFACASQKFKLWYRFENHKWVESEEGADLRIKISKELVEDYLDILNIYQPVDINSYADVKLKNKKKIQHHPALAEYGKCNCNSCSGGANELGDTESEIGENNKKIRDSIRNLTKQLQTTKFKTDVMSECREIFWDKNFLKYIDNSPVNEFLISFENGVYDLEKGEFRDGRPEDYISKTVEYSYIEYTSDDDIYNEMEDFVNKVLPEPEIREYVLTLFASFLEGIAPNEKFYIFTGSGANGKSKLLELLQYVIGEYAVIFPSEMITEKRGKSSAASPELVRSKGCRLGLFQEPGPGEVIQVGLLKWLTGGDKIAARDLYKPMIEFKPRFKLVLTCNNLPTIPSTDQGTWRRMEVIQAKAKFVKPEEFEKAKQTNDGFVFLRDNTIAQKLPKWKEPFMCLLLKYYKKYQKEGLVVPDEVIKYTKEYEESCNVYLEYIDHNLIITNNPEEYNKLKDIYPDFKVWYKSTYDEKAPPMTAFKTYMHTYRKDLAHNKSKDSWRIKLSDNKKKQEED